MATNEQILDALKSVMDTNTGKDFVSSKCIKNLNVSEGDVSFDAPDTFKAAVAQVTQARTPWREAWARWQGNVTPIDYVLPAGNPSDNLWLSPAQMRRTDPKGRPIHHRQGQRLHSPHRMRHKGGLHDQILRLIACHEHLGQRHHLRTRIAALLPRMQGQGCVLVYRAHRGVQLGKGQAECVGHGLLC